MTVRHTQCTRSPRVMRRITELRLVVAVLAGALALRSRFVSLWTSRTGRRAAAERGLLRGAVPAASCARGVRPAPARGRRPMGRWSMALVEWPMGLAARGVVPRASRGALREVGFAARGGRKAPLRPGDLARREGNGAQRSPDACAAPAAGPRTTRRDVEPADAASPDAGAFDAPSVFDGSTDDAAARDAPLVDAFSEEPAKGGDDGGASGGPSR